MPNQPQVSTKTRLPITRLRGFYITPFGRKTVAGESKDAVNSVTMNVDFDRVIDNISEFFSSHREHLGDIDYRFSVTTAAKKVRGKYLDQSIQRHIDDADFLIVDWTTLNPNVLLEAGYGRGRAKPGLHLTADGNFPSDRAGIIYAQYDPENLREISKVLTPHVANLVTRVISTPRVFDYYDQRSAELVRQMIRTCRRRIYILQTNLETLHTNHMVDLEEARERGVKIRILTLDPQSRYVNERALQLGYKTGQISIYRNGLQGVIEDVVRRLCLPGFRMRLYNDFPNQLTYIFDQYVLASVISRTGRSRDNCCFLVPAGQLPGAKHTFIDHFNQLWKKADQEFSGDPSRGKSGRKVL